MLSSEKVTVVTETTDVTPAMLAKWFWAMDSIEQADFFAALAEETKGAKFDGSLQWCYMTHEIERRDMATRTCFLDFCSFAYNWFEHKTAGVDFGGLD